MVMRVLRASFLIFIALSAASAAGLKVKVTDPQSAPVAGARVSLFVNSPGRTRARIATTSAEGIATFQGLSSCTCELEVLAPGFAPQHTILANQFESVFTVQLQLAV